MHRQGQHIPPSEWGVAPLEGPGGLSDEDHRFWSEVVRFRSSGAAGVLVNNGAGVTAHRWLKVAFIPVNVVKATFDHNRTASAATTVTPTTNAPPRTPLALLLVGSRRC